MTKLKVLLPIVAVIIVGATIAVLATQAWNPLWNPFSLSREATLAKAITKLATLKSFKVQGNINFEIKDSENKDEAENFKVSIDFISNLDVKTPKSSSEVKLSLGTEQMAFSLSGEVRGIGGDIYLMAKTLPNIPFLFSNIEELKNQWFKISKEKLTESLGTEAVENIEEETEKEIINEFVRVFGKRKGEFFKVKSDFGMEEVDGVESHHFLLLLKEQILKEAILEFLQEIKKYLPEEEKGSYEEKLKEIIKDLPENFEDFFEKTGPITFEAWIDKDNWLRRIKGEKEIKLSQFEQLEEFDLGETKVKIEIDLKLSDFNKKVEVASPEEFKSIEEILPPGMLGAFSPSQFLLPQQTPQPESVPGGEEPLSPEEIEELLRGLQEE